MATFTRGRKVLPACLVAVLTCLATNTKAVPPPALSLSSQASARFAIADFDGDSQPDLATVLVGQVTASHARYWIHFQLSGGGRQLIGMTAPVGGLEIALKDVNGDQSLDVVVTTSWLNRPVAVLLNDGHGNFTLRDPAAFPKAVSNHEASCSIANVQLKDAPAVLLRTGGDCEHGRAVSCMPRVSRRLGFGLTHPSLRWPSLSLFGRGPPFVVNNA